MAYTNLKVDNGVSVSVPAGYSYNQVIGLASAIYTQYFCDHDRFAYRLSGDRTILTVFPVN